MRKLLTTAAVAGLAAGALVAPQAADAAPPAPLADQLILCNGFPGVSLNVTVENLTDDSTGPVPFNLGARGCEKIVDGNPVKDDPSGTPISATYRVAFEPATKSPQDMITILTSSSQTRTVQGSETNVAISSLEGVQVTFATPD